MTTESNSRDDAFAAELPAPSPDAPAIQSPPAIWPVFIAYAVAFVGSVLVQIVIAIGIFLWHVGLGAPTSKVQEVARELPALLTTPMAFVWLGLASQLVIGLTALASARLSREPIRSRLGWVKPAMPAWGYPVLAIGALVPLAAGLGLAYLITMVMPADASAAMLYEQMTWRDAVPFILFITLMPAFMEEVLFRGYIQRGLFQRWSPSMAILVCSILFALMHVTPVAIAAVLPLGIWQGAVAWRTGSVWPGIVCHAFVNGSWNISQISARLIDWPDATPTLFWVTGGPLVLACFVAGVWLLVRRPAPPND
jgi:membrane protease YdiL (CAAX protease family)